MSIPVEARFWSLVDRGPDDEPGCWEWQGALNKARYGYGYFYFDGKPTLAHHVSWLMAYGVIPAGKQVHHHCDNPRCVRPSHLWLGVQKQNVDDMMAKRRRRYVLTPEVAAEVRRLRTLGISIHRTSAQLGIGVSAIKHVLAGRTWSEAA
jgi:hypothetical protein